MNTTTNEMNTMTRAQLIDELNVFRVHANVEKIEKTKMNRAQLIDAINAMRDAYIDNDNAKHDDVAIDVALNAIDVDVASIAHVAQNVTVAQLSRELNIDPKIARARLRRHAIFATNHAHVILSRDTQQFRDYVAIITNVKKRDNA